MPASTEPQAPPSDENGGLRHRTSVPELRRDVLLLVVALLALAVWEWSGADLWLIRHYGTTALQMALRGAHYLSHSMWTAWLCWVMAWISGWALLRNSPELQRAWRRICAAGFQPKLGACGLATGRPAATQAP